MKLFIAIFIAGLIMGTAFGIVWLCIEHPNVAPIILLIGIFLLLVGGIYYSIRE